MGKITKMGDTIAERLAKTKGAIPPTTAIRAGRSSTDAVSTGLDDMAAYDAAQGSLDASRSTPAAPQEVRAEIARVEAEQAEEARVAGISPTSKKADWDAQAQTPEEFQARVGQLTDPDHATSAIERGVIDANLADPSQHGIEVGEKYKVWETDQGPVLEVVRNNEELMNWGKEGAYTRGQVFGETVENAGDPVIFYRMDLRGDPRTDLTPIQFDPAANQFGMHIGTKRAGNGIITPQGIKANKDKMTRITSMFDDLAEKDPQARLLFDEALEEARTNGFLRYGEDPFATPNREVFNDLVDDFFEELQILAKEKGARGLQDIDNVDAFKRRLTQAMIQNLDPVQHPVMTNVKQGLFVQDLGPKNTAAGIVENLEGRGIFPQDRLDAIGGMRDNEAQNIALRELLQENGYDHLIYINNGEDNGVISIVLFNEDNYQNLYKPTMGRNNMPTGHQVSNNTAFSVIGDGIGPPATVTSINTKSLKTLDDEMQTLSDQIDELEKAKKEYPALGFPVAAEDKAARDTANKFFEEILDDKIDDLHAKFEKAEDAFNTLEGKTPKSQ